MAKELEESISIDISMDLSKQGLSLNKNSGYQEKKRQVQDELKKLQEELDVNLDFLEGIGDPDFKPSKETLNPPKHNYFTKKQKKIEKQKNVLRGPYKGFNTKNLGIKNLKLNFN